MRKDGPHLRWACGYGRPGLANGPIGPVGPYFTIYPIYPLHYSSSEFPFQAFHTTLSRFPDDLEILSILRSMHPLKSPSPYGFHAQFFQNN